MQVKQRFAGYNIKDDYIIQPYLRRLHSPPSLPHPHLGDYLIYLDPHTTQPVVAKGPTHIPDATHIPDTTYHCSQADRMRIEELDPSIALVSWRSYFV